MIRHIRRLAGVGVWCQAFNRFCVGAFGRNLASVSVKMLSHSIYFISKFYKYNFNTNSKYDPAINYITVQQKIRYIPVKFYGSYTRLVKGQSSSAGL